MGAGPWNEGKEALHQAGRQGGAGNEDGGRGPVDFRTPEAP